MVVPRLPSPVRKVLIFPLFADIEATGVPPALLTKANFAVSVEIPPTNKSLLI